MKKILIILCLMITTMTGCSNAPPQQNTNQAVEVVTNYLENSSSGKWDKVIPLLSGQALYETKKNISLVKHTEKILAKDIKVLWASDNLAEVYADVTKNTPIGDDRIAYKFYCRKEKNQWKIYKTELADIIRPALKNVDLDPAIEDVIKNYFALKTTEKRAQDTKYLAGKLLRLSLTSKQVQGGINNAPDTAQKVINITPIGTAADYAVTEVLFEGFEGNGVTGTAVVDLVKVNNNWKIVQLDIADLKR